MYAETNESPPYGPAANLKTVFETWRDRSMPESVGKEWLERIGISPNLTAKNLHALRFLGLIDAEQYTTSVAQRLRTATSEEYPVVLEEILRRAYHRVFEIRNPSVDSRTRIDDAFRHEQPQAQRSRMVACFLGLCALAGIPLKEAPPVRDSPSRRGSASGSKKPRESVAASDPAPPRFSEVRTVFQSPPPARASGAFNEILSGLLKAVEDLESVEELDEWFQVFRATFLFVRSRTDKAKSEAGG